MVLTPRLRTWRERRTLTLRELAATSGVAFSTIHRLETGKPGELRTIRRLAAALEVDPAELMAPLPAQETPRPIQVVTTPVDQTPRTVNVVHTPVDMTPRTVNVESIPVDATPRTVYVTVTPVDQTPRTVTVVSRPVNVLPGGVYAPGPVDAP